MATRPSSRDGDTERHGRFPFFTFPFSRPHRLLHVSCVKFRPRHAHRLAASPRDWTLPIPSTARALLPLQLIDVHEITTMRAAKKAAEQTKMSRSVGSLEPLSAARSVATHSSTNATMQLPSFLSKAQTLYNGGNYSEALAVCEKIYDFDAHRTENLLLMGAIHFQLRNYSESVFYNQQCIRVDPNFAEAYSNLGNALKELGDLKGATQFYSKVRAHPLRSWLFINRLSLRCIM